MHTHRCISGDIRIVPGRSFAIASSCRRDRVPKRNTEAGGLGTFRAPTPVPLHREFGHL